MPWKFWKKAAPCGPLPHSRVEGGPLPGALPLAVGRYLVKELGKDPRGIRSLRGVVRPMGGSRESYEIRIFDREQVERRGVLVTNYSSLDNHLDLVLFKGWFHKTRGTLHIEERKGSKNAPVA